jgi:hypothetical protein
MKTARRDAMTAEEREQAVNGVERLPLGGASVDGGSGNSQSKRRHVQ